MSQKGSPDKPKLIVIAGPTASGKSDLAIRLARALNGEIISADSRQVYKGMDIGTGKVTKREQKLARHWLIDVASPTRQYTVAHFVRNATKAIRDITKRGKVPIICGGTGFWIDALVYGTSIPDVKPDAKLRAKLQKLSTSQLFSKLQKLDPTRAQSIDPKNPVRLIRALEIVMKTGKPVPQQSATTPYHVLYLCVSRNAEELRARIEKRLDARLRQGMIAEVQKLHTQGVSWKKLESFGLEYRWVARFLQKKIARDEMRTALLHDIIAYSKRQLTWWRRNGDVRWVKAGIAQMV
ncbi:MAG: tRNA (adenosine(37)-N6)-dimethylallyltransferase MiaA [Candidatus Paceibacterota bacterium]|nr:MAG: tRNA (adenosine(37)-N6)-dimethylallyltransferase MiaA [Candidatus Paceibacterota bacterium]